MSIVRYCPVGKCTKLQYIIGYYNLLLGVITDYIAVYCSMENIPISLFCCIIVLTIMQYINMGDSRQKCPNWSDQNTKKSQILVH